MKRTNLLFSILLSTVLVGCKSNSARNDLNDVSDSTIVINFKDITVESIPTSSFIESVRYMNLEFSDQAILSTIIQIKTVDTLIYILDSDNRLKCFHTETGKFLRDTYVKGRGPNEITELSDFEIDDNYLYLMDTNRGRVLAFNHSGSFHKEIPLAQRALSMKKMGNGGWLLALAPFAMDDSEQHHQLAFCDSAFNVLGHQFAQTIRYFRHPYFENSDEPRYFTPIFGRSIYEQINDTTFQMKYFLDMGRYFPSEETPTLRTALDEGIMHTYRNPLHNSDYLFQSFYCSKDKGLIGNLIIRLQDHKSIFAKYIMGDTDEIIDFTFESIAGYNSNTDEFFGCANAYYLSDMGEKEFSKLRSMVRPIYQKYLLKDNPENSNQTIFFMKMKKNITAFK